MIDYQMNQFLKQIHKDYLIIYRKNNQYFVIDHFVYIFRSLFKFRYCLKNGRKVIFIEESYLNYILKKLREACVNYVIIHIHYGYDKQLEYFNKNNQYSYYYCRGKNMIKNEKRVVYLLNRLEEKNDIQLIKKVESVIQYD